MCARVRRMERDSFRRPMKILCERGVFSRHSKIDMVLGDDDVLVEFKLEPDYPRVSKYVVFSTIKEDAHTAKDTILTYKAQSIRKLLFSSLIRSY